MALFAARPANAQSLLDRPPNMSGTWIGDAGTVYFNFLHRFEATPAPARKVINYPTFLLATPIGNNVLLGAQYATNSLLVANYPNEWQFFGRINPLAKSQSPWSVAATAAYSQPARSFDGELAVARDFGALHLMAAGRAFSSFRRSHQSRWAVAGGATFRVTSHMALAGDVATLLDRGITEKVAWGAGLHVAIPSTPHTLSLHVSNANTTTLEGASIGLSSHRRFGFEFTIPFTTSRYFGGHKETTVVSVAAENAVEVRMNDQLRFEPAAIRVKAGTTILWRNTSALVHTVTGDAFDSGDVKPGETWSHTFATAGEFRYKCTPHSAAGMVGRVIVE